ncbi:hypothetical protein FGB62_159g01 [Gracilaria domingensis]|nr:hypothetical protein FGB62_159g01 [Gracilaria domingensis]
MHRVAHGYGPTALLRLQKYLKVGLERLNAGKYACDNVTLISFSENAANNLNTMLDGAQELKDANVSKAMNSNAGKYKQRRREKFNLERPGSRKKRNKRLGTDPGSQIGEITKKREPVKKALVMALAIVDHPENQCVSMRSAEK